MTLSAFSLKLLYFLVFSSLLTCSVLADQIFLQNGDRISGQITRMKDGVVDIKTSFAGRLKINIADIKRIYMDEPAPLLNDQGGLTEQQYLGAKSPEGTEEPYPLEQVQILFPTVVDLGEKGNLTGELNFSLKLENKSTQSDEIDSDFRFDYRFQRHLYSTQFQLEYDREDSVTDKQDWLSANQYSYYYQENQYLTYWYALKQEKYDGLYLRQTTGPGWGFKFETSPRTMSTTEFGVSYNHEDYIDEPTQEFISVTWLLNFERLLFKDQLRFYHRHQSGISVKDADKQLWHSWTGFSVPLLVKYKASIEYEIDYDSAPETRTQNTNTTLRFKLGRTW